MRQPIYLDGHATTPPDPRVIEALLPFLRSQFGNPASMHPYGWEAAAAVDQARQSLAEAIGATPDSLVFTSGATEANNLAIKGVGEAYFSHGHHLITAATEHRAVLEPCRYLARLGFELTVLPVDVQGLLDPQQVAAAIRSDTLLVSVMAANNEIGVLQPLAEIGAICHERGVLFHSDAAQALGKIPLDVDAMQIDLLSLTAHKLYGPKGVGALYVRQHNPRVNLAPQLHGGGQERGLRSGTLAPAQIVGFAKAVELALAEIEAEGDRQRALRDRLWQRLQGLGGVHLNGHPQHRLPGNLHVSFEGVLGSELLLGLREDLAVSSGSACSSEQPSPSHVLQALGVAPDLALASLRFGLGRFTTPEEIERAASAVVATVQRLRGSRTWTPAASKPSKPV
jgi:cysteine desulfurase